MIELAAGRPSLIQPLRAAEPQQDDKTLTLTVAPHFVPLAEIHADEYRDLARRALGRNVQVRFVAGTGADEADGESPEEARNKELMAQAEQEPAVQESLEIFGGRLVSVREDDPVR
jgi:hypothetical protein